MTPNDDNNTLRIKSTVIYIIEGGGGGGFEFIHTKQPIKKYLNNILNRNKRKTKLKTLLQSENSAHTRVETIDYRNICEVTDRINVLKINLSQIYFRGKYSKDNKKGANGEKFPIDDYKYGKTEEYAVLSKINAFFRNDIIVMCQFKMSRYDYMGLKSQYIYELKSNKDKFGDYSNAIIGVEKIIDYSKQIFLFQFLNQYGDNDLYYFIKPDNFVTTYRKRDIFLKYRNKINTVYDIPRTELKPIISGEYCDLDITANVSADMFRHLQYLDEVGAIYC